MSVDIEALGLKSSYVFKETHIPTSHERNVIHQQLRQIVAPAIQDLESQQLINGFHHIIHEEIDLRLSCDDWPQYESRIREVLAVHSIPSDLKDWGPMPPNRYGGEIGVLLCYNNLEFNSRLSLALAELMDETHDESVRQMQEKVCPHQWVHYLCNQFGYLNLNQIVFELNDAFVWLKAFITRNAGNPQATFRGRDIINRFRGAADHFERNFLDG